MKAAPFDYMRATSIDEACRALAEAGEDARIIAGGQTLVPLMAMRMARPTLLVDITGIAELSGIDIDGDGDGDELVIKACTRQADGLASDIVRQSCPLLAEALSHVGHTQTRNRGTVGGSLCNADPSAEIPLIVCTLDAIMVARSPNGERRIAADAFFDFAMTTALEPDECLTEIRFPSWRGPGTGHGVHEVSIRDSDFALAAAASQATLDGSGNCTRIHVAIGGASPTPMRLGPVEQALTGGDLSDGAISDACAAILDLVEPQSDVHADAEYRRRVARVMAIRAIASARDAAGATR